MNRHSYPVNTMCHFFGISRSGYYGNVKRLNKRTHDADLADMIREQQEKCDKTYGYRRMWKWLKQAKGIHRNSRLCSHKCINNKCKMDKSRKDNIKFIITGKNAAKMFDTAEKSLDLIALLVQLFIIVPRIFAIAFGWDNRCITKFHS